MNQRFKMYSDPLIQALSSCKRLIVSFFQFYLKPSKHTAKCLSETFIAFGNLNISNSLPWENIRRNYLSIQAPKIGDVKPSLNFVPTQISRVNAKFSMILKKIWEILVKNLYQPESTVPVLGKFLTRFQDISTPK